MSFLDFLKRTPPLEKHAKRATNKRAQNIDRMESLHALSRMNSTEAARALLQRFRFRVDPSIVDQEEKEVAFEGLVALGDVAIEPTREYLLASDSISWPLKIMNRLLDEAEVVVALLDLLSEMDVEYERDPEKKIQVIGYLGDRQDSRILEAVRRFLDDPNETVRFSTVVAMLAQQVEDTDVSAALIEPLVNRLADEESVRIRDQIASAFVERGWKVPIGELDRVGSALSDRFRLDRTNRVLSPVA